MPTLDHNDPELFPEHEAENDAIWKSMQAGLKVKRVVQEEQEQLDDKPQEKT